MNTDELMQMIREIFDDFSYVKSQDVPNIDLYMDQVTTFMDKNLRMASRYPDADKVMTKTMINNYAKNDLLPPPVKKRYSKEHVLVLVFIYFYKGILSINDIRTLLGPVTDRFFHTEDEFNIEAVYNEIVSLEQGQMEDIRGEVLDKYKTSQTAFEQAPEESRDMLRLFSFICMLSFDVYMKKALIEKLIDGMKQNDDKKEKK